MCAKGFVDLASKFLFLLYEAIELGLCYFDIATTILTIIVIAFSRAKIYLINAIVLSIVAILLNHSVSKNVDKVSKVKTVGGAIRRSTNSRHLRKP